MTLRVEPEERTGLLGAEYHLTAGETVLWHGRRPFALNHAAVGEDGLVAGVAYTSGKSEPPEIHTLEIVLLSPDGEVLLQESHPMESLRVSHAGKAPRVHGLFLQPELGRFVVWLRALREDGTLPLSNRVRSYDLRSGGLLSEKHLDDWEDLLDLRPVPGTPLLVSNWVRVDFKDGPAHKDAVFRLLDADWNVLWMREIEKDDEETTDTWSRRYAASILSTSEARFELRSVLAGEKLSFAVDRAGAGWKVNEVGRAPLVPPPAAELTTGPAVSARLVARVPLEAGEPRWTPWRGYVDSTFGRVLLQDVQSRVTQVFDADGHLLAVCDPQPEQREAALAGQRDWGLVVELTTGPDGRIYVGNRRGYARFSPTGAPEGVVEIRSLVGFPPTPGRHWSLHDQVLICSPDLQLARRPDGRWFRGIRAVASAGDGSLAVLDVVGDTQTLLLFDPVGKPRRTIPLPLEPFVVAIAFQGHRVLGTGWEKPLLVDTEDGSVRPLELDTPITEDRPRMGLSPDGSEVWVLEREARILARYAIGE